MARHRNGNWNLPDGKVETWDQVQVAVLMDIRDELQKLNRLMECSNVRAGFIALQRIDKRLAKKVKLR